MFDRDYDYDPAETIDQREREHAEWRKDKVAICYPVSEWATAEKIAMAYSDAVANGKIEQDDLGKTTMWEQAAALDSAGIITLVAPQKRYY